MPSGQHDLGSGSSNLLVFVGGLHRSGTSPLYRAIALHRDVSALPKEGQALQGVYPTGRDLGGPGCFGFSAYAHLTESSSLATDATRSRLFEDWGPHWDLRKPVLIEKSPPNLLKMRFLQALFPRAAFVMVIRHPIPVTLATEAKWGSRSPLDTLRHWFACHELFMADTRHMKRLIVLRYEDLVEVPTLVTQIQAALGLNQPNPPPQPKADLNKRYFEKWSLEIPQGFEERARAFGYSLTDPIRTDIHPAPAVASLLMSAETPAG